MEAVKVHLWTRAQYERMGEVGILKPDARTELIRGEIIEVSPQKSLHATAVRLAQETLRVAFGEHYDVRAQLPLALSEIDEPEPDLVVVKGSPRDYRDAHPTEALLVVEVAESSLSFDRNVKVGLYAQSGVPEYWIVNLVDSTLEVYRDPVGEVYRSKLVFEAPDELSPLTRPEAMIQVAELLP